MHHGFALTYTDLFQGSPPDLDVTVSKLPSNLALKYLAYLSGKLHKTAYRDDVQRELIDGLIRRLEPPIRDHVWNRFELLNKRSQTTLLDVFTVMELMNRVIANYNNVEVPDSTPVDEYNLLLSILIVNDLIYNKTIPKELPIQGQFNYFCAFTWPILVKTVEIRLKKDAFHEIYRGIKFAEYLDNSETFNPLFRTLFNLEEEPFYTFPYHLFHFYTQNGLNHEDNTMYSFFTMNLEEENLYTIPWILHLGNGDLDNYESSDYKTLRSFPIIKFKDNDYTIVNWNFILDKQFTGLIFDLYNKSGVSIKGHENYNHRLRKLSNFKSEISGDFSENFCIELFNSCLGQNYVQKIGKPDQVDNQDLYLRLERKIALIEHKDPLFIKTDNYLEIKEVLDKKLARDQGVPQLIEHIKKMRDNIDVFEDGLSNIMTPRKLTVYPVLVVTESAFVLTGMEDYVNRCFREKLIELGSLPFYVHRLVIIDVYSLMNMHDSLALNKEELFGLFDKFYKKKFKLKKIARKEQKKPNMNINKVSGQYQGFSEVIGNNLRQIVHGKPIEGTLKAKLFDLFELLEKTKPINL